MSDWQPASLHHWDLIPFKEKLIEDDTCFCDSQTLKQRYWSQSEFMLWMNSIKLMQLRWTTDHDNILFPFFQTCISPFFFFGVGFEVLMSGNSVWGNGGIPNIWRTRERTILTSHISPLLHQKWLMVLRYRHCCCFWDHIMAKQLLDATVVKCKSSK